MNTYDFYLKELTFSDTDMSKKKFIDAYLDIWNFKQNLQFLSYTGQVFSESQVHDWVFGLSENCPIRYLYCTLDKLIVGIVVLELNNITGCEILGIGVRQEYKSRGIGGKLLNESIKICIQADFKSIQTTVFADNITMQRSILKLGFCPVEMEYGKRFDGMGTVKYLYMKNENQDF